MYRSLEFKTAGETSFISLNQLLADMVKESGVQEGLMTVYCPHTTAAITINENADPDVRKDLELALNEISPKRGEYRHREGNSDAHVKASLLGASAQIIIHQGRLVLGVWQDVYFCEFDGPRKRTVHIKIQADS